MKVAKALSAGDVDRLRELVRDSPKAVGGPAVKFLKKLGKTRVPNLTTVVRILFGTEAVEPRVAVDVTEAAIRDGDVDRLAALLDGLLPTARKVLVHCNRRLLEAAIAAGNGPQSWRLLIGMRLTVREDLRGLGRLLYDHPSFLRAVLVDHLAVTNSAACRGVVTPATRWLEGLGGELSRLAVANIATEDGVSMAVELLIACSVGRWTWPGSYGRLAMEVMRPMVDHEPRDLHDVPVDAGKPWGSVERGTTLRREEHAYVTRLLGLWELLDSADDARYGASEHIDLDEVHDRRDRLRAAVGLPKAEEHHVHRDTFPIDRLAEFGGARALAGDYMAHVNAPGASEACTEAAKDGLDDCGYLMDEEEDVPDRGFVLDRYLVAGDRAQQLLATLRAVADVDVAAAVAKMRQQHAERTREKREREERERKERKEREREKERARERRKQEELEARVRRAKEAMEAEEWLDF